MIIEFTYSKSNYSDQIAYGDKIRQLVREGYHMTEREPMPEKSFTIKNEWQFMRIYVQKSVDAEGQETMNLGVS